MSGGETRIRVVPPRSRHRRIGRCRELCETHSASLGEQVGILEALDGGGHFRGCVYLGVPGAAVIRVDAAKCPPNQFSQVRIKK